MGTSQPADTRPGFRQPNSIDQAALLVVGPSRASSVCLGPCPRKGERDTHSANPSKAILGGFVATLAMTILMYAGPMMGLPRMDIAAMLGSLFAGGQPPLVGSSMWWAGMVLHFVNGSVIFSLLYGYAVYGWLRGDTWLRGTIWGFALWLLAQVMVMPIMGMGMFSANTPAPAPMVLGSLIGHLVYGAILGQLAGVQAEHGRTEPRQVRA